MISVVTISRQLGSGGSELAKKIAELCDFHLIWREVINQAAIKIGAPEVALAMIDELGLFGLFPDEATCSAYCTAVQQVMFKYAESGNVVIVGRASQMILKDYPNTLHIRVIADLNTRIQTLSKTKKITQQAARSQIIKSDSSRQKYLKDFYQVDLNDPALYDITLNSGRISIDQASAWISSLIKTF